MTDERRGPTQNGPKKQKHPHSGSRHGGSELLLRASIQTWIRHRTNHKLSKVQHRLAKLLLNLSNDYQGVQCTRKWVAVIRHLGVSSKVMPNQSKERQRARQTPVNVEAIEAFYSRQDISREAPGMKDTVIVRTAGIKEIKRKRHLM